MSIVTTIMTRDRDEKKAIEGFQKRVVRRNKHFLVVASITIFMGYIFLPEHDLICQFSSTVSFSKRLLTIIGLHTMMHTRAFLRIIDTAHIAFGGEGGRTKLHQ